MLKATGNGGGGVECLAGDDDRDKVGFTSLRGLQGSHFLALAFLHMLDHHTSVAVLQNLLSNWQLML